MRFSLRPDRLYARYTQITPQILTREGVRLVLCDLDYTLAPKSVHRPDEAVRGWLEALEAAGITVMILSNNRSTRRVETFCRDLGIRYIGHAHKPLKRLLQQVQQGIIQVAQHKRLPGMDGGAAGRAGGGLEPCAAPAAKAV